ncbi:MAG: hypothetical protein ACRD16_11605 [Thermoanaerobaculia bacterium]
MGISSQNRFPTSRSRRALVGPLLGLLLVAAGPGTLLAANSVSNIVFSPASPATVGVYPSTTGVPPANQRVNVTFSYTTTDTNGVAVYFGGNFSWYAGVNNRCAFPSGTCSGWFTATSPVTVSSLTVYMQDWNDTNPNDAIYTTTTPGNFTFTSSPPPATACQANSTTLCIDDAPGDKRYSVQVAFATSQGGGSSGNGHAIPLSSLGVSRGGLFWFFSADNPELLIKILSTCSFSSAHWVFASAGTNVGLTITVTDTKTAFQRVYSNADLTPMEPIQDTSAAMPCP